MLQNLQAETNAERWSAGSQPKLEMVFFFGYDILIWTL